MKILLVEANYKTSILSFALQKFAGKHLSEGDEVRFAKGISIVKGFFENWYPDKIYVTSLFTYHGNEVIKTVNAYRKAYPNAEIRVGGIFASLMPNYVYNETCIKPHVGILNEVESAIPDFSIFPKTNKQTLFTSRGCIRKCGFCAVKTLEPKYYIHPTWKQQFNPNYHHVLIQDNNIIASPMDHQKDVVDFLSSLDKKIYTVDFNGGFDCRIFTEEHAELYKNVNVPIVRFAFDNTETEDGHIQKAIKLAREIFDLKRVMVYTLYNYLDSPEDFYYRMKEILNSHGLPYPMKYSPLDALNRKFVGEKWTRKQLRNFQKILSKISYGRMAFPEFYAKEKNVKIFEDIYGRNEKEFVELLNRTKDIQFYRNIGVKTPNAHSLLEDYNEI